ncbi:MAG: D-hexose-6-phosphate mutarotase [Halioglobus sp.]
MDTLHHLNQMVADVPQASIHEIASGYPAVRIKNSFGAAEIALHGAHLTEFIPTASTPVIFLSSDAVFAAGTPIRGGIPICWPWFSRHEHRDDFPSHGIARTSFWTLQNVCHEGEFTRVEMALSTDGTDPRWPFLSCARISFTIGAHLSVALTTQNLGEIPFDFSDALHCYFQLGEAKQADVTGLTGADYVFSLADNEIKVQSEPIIIDQAIDRIFQTTGSSTIVDRENQRVIVVSKSGSSNTVVWNPGKAGARNMTDLADEEYRRFVCVEPANAHPSPMTLSAGESHTTKTVISVNPLPARLNDNG